MAKKNVLGKGMASLLKSNPNAEKLEKAMNASKSLRSTSKKTELAPEENSTGGGPLLVDREQIVANPYQPRKNFDEDELKGLAQSIKENGILQPLVVTKGKKGFVLIAGERRLRAAEQAGIEKVPVIVRRSTERDQLILAILENVQRSELNCVEEALAYYKLMDEFSLGQDEVAQKMGKERSSVANLLRLLKLPTDVLEMLKSGDLSFGHGKLLAGVGDSAQVIKLAKEVLKEKLSVRQLENLLKAEKSIKASAENKKTPQDYVQRDLQRQIESKLGIRADLRMDHRGEGKMVLKFKNMKQFNSVFDLLMR